MYSAEWVIFLDFNNNTKTYETILASSEHHGSKVKKFGSVERPLSAATFEEDFAEFIHGLSEADFITTFVFSGHHGNNVFSGVTGELAVESFAKVLTLYPNVLESTSKLILRGCYTVTATTILPDSPWRNIFPNVSLIMGFEKKAWDDAKPMSYEFISEALAWNPKKVYTLRPALLEGQFRAIPHQSTTALGIWGKHTTAPLSGLFLSTENGFNRRLTRTIEQHVRQCDLNYDVKQYHKAVVREFASGERPIPNDSSVGDLREAYDFFSTQSHCFRMSAKWIDDRHSSASLLDGKNSLRYLMTLLFFNNIKNNFDAYMKMTVGERWYDGWSAYLSASEEVALPKFIQADGFGAINYSDIQQSKADIVSVMHNNPPSQRVHKSINYLFMNIMLRQNELVMPDRWMTEAQSLAMPKVVSEMSDAGLVVGD